LHGKFRAKLHDLGRGLSALDQMQDTIANGYTAHSFNNAKRMEAPARTSIPQSHFPLQQAIPTTGQTPDFQ
jgi:predicted mannosyl-3-phosphoglycerate phosphatase (HAD superfamily)